MVDKEMLTAMSEMLDQKFDEKLKPVYDGLDKLDEQLENNVIPRLDRLESDMTYVKEEQLENNVIPRLDKLESDMTCVRVEQLENGIIPRLNTIEKYYIETSVRYNNSSDKIDEMSMNISNLLSTVKKHSQKLNKISV